ncbi:unnamed protein product [Paramecium sonneborni]|uniref:Uncharacterized protein n=1 Tax=Paramecium sonneborni TaxID=65129 RepID=A0A8S1RRZ3_9CILI|nr:unnamed protein product [Paramecium sonneborni]
MTKLSNIARHQLLLFMDIISFYHLKITFWQQHIQYRIYKKIYQSLLINFHQQVRFLEYRSRIVRIYYQLYRDPYEFQAMSLLSLLKSLTLNKNLE